MNRIWYRSIPFDRCENCGGLWFDRFEAEWLKTEEGAEAIDTGDPEVGLLQNQQGLIECPICSIPMIRMVDAKQPHIWYEKCAACAGVYFDAGEFKDYKEYTVEDLIKKFSVSERPY
jgi:Zn-finger nucleic acid-binding protein